MSAIGHTMATMSRNGGKPNVANSSSSSNESTRRRNANTGRRANGSNNDTAAARGQNINHLLAFTLPPRISNPTAHTGARRPRRGNGSFVPFNKERYVNAQYRFLVKPTGDYTAYFADADIFLNWSDILTVLIPTTSALSTASHASAHATLSSQPDLETHEGVACPICLSPPTAPRMTRCGHVYCYPCILHYLTVNDAPSASGSTTPTPSYHQHVPGAGPRNTPSSVAGTPTGLSASNVASAAPKWKRCPVCWDAVYARDVKAVQWWDPKARAQEFDRENEEAQVQSQEGRNDEPTTSGGDSLCMRLIERPHLTNLALPKSSTWPTASTSTSDQPLIAQHAAPWHFQPDVMTFSKFMLATPDILLRNLNHDLEQLNEERQLLQSFMSSDEVGLMFVNMAERKVQEQMEKVANELDTQSVRSRIGYARKELAEHNELEKGNKERNAEAMSRRQRKRLERERKDEAESEEMEDGSHQTKDDSVEEEAQRSADMEGTQDFLAVRSQTLGGSLVTPAVFSDDKEKSQQDTASIQKESRPPAPRTRRNLNPPAPSSSSFYFFQASSGQSIFLHPLDIKILLSAYGSYAAFPQTLQVCIQGADEGSMNEEMRKRCKYLTHLSKGADIVFIEVDWDKMIREAEARRTAPAVSRSTLKAYDQALRQRRNRRRDRERREDRAKFRSEENERASRPTPMTSQPIGIGGLSRSPALTAQDVLGSSLGSQSTLSPSVQEALLRGDTETSSVRSDDEFPAARPEGLAITDVDDEDAGDWQTDQQHGSTNSTKGTSQRRQSNSSKPVSSSARTVWGTPAAKGNSFANALHHSSRTTGGASTADEEGPDWDAWLELEEDFIVGARNNTTIREGRGLNRQAKSGGDGHTSATTKTVTPTPAAPIARSANGGGKVTGIMKQQSSQSSGENVAAVKLSDVKATGDADKDVPSHAQSRTTPGGKQQKKKKLVLTSGGGGRGTR